MPKRMTSIRLSEATDEQLDQLSHYGNQSEIISIAIDRMAREERRNMSTNVYWGDIFGSDATGAEIVQNWQDEQPDMTLAEFCEHVSRTIWGDDHNENVNWGDIARQIQEDAEYSE